MLLIFGKPQAGLDKSSELKKGKMISHLGDRQTCMKKHLRFIGAILIFVGNHCSAQDNNQTFTPNKNVLTASEGASDKASAAKEYRKQPSDFVPKGYVIFERISGDLDKDGMKDCILIIKGTDKSKIIKGEDGTKLDRNRRGIVILFKKKDGYRLASENDTCFSSENEDGGVYFPPELSVYVQNGNLYIHYGHGRYGYWRYIFRFKESDFELIGYEDSDDHGPVVNSETSINFLTKKEKIRENVNENAMESGDEVFKETWKDINIKGLTKLSEIKDFDEIEMPE